MLRSVVDNPIEIIDEQISRNSKYASPRLNVKITNFIKVLKEYQSLIEDDMLESQREGCSSKIFYMFWL